MSGRNLPPVLTVPAESLKDGTLKAVDTYFNWYGGVGNIWLIPPPVVPPPGKVNWDEGLLMSLHAYSSKVILSVDFTTLPTTVPPTVVTHGSLAGYPTCSAPGSLSLDPQSPEIAKKVTPEAARR